MYKLEDKEFDFERVTAKDALRIKSAFMVIANDKASSEAKAEEDSVISEIAIKYLKIKVGKEWIENCSEEYISECFKNEFAIVEVIAKFQERISGFLSLLPSFQSAKAKGK